MNAQYKLEPCDINEVKSVLIRKAPKHRPNRDGIGLINEFADSDYDCCKVCHCGDNRKAHIEVTILRRSIKSSGHYHSVRVIQRGDCVYLVKRNKWDIS